MLLRFRASRPGSRRALQQQCRTCGRFHQSYVMTGGDIIRSSGLCAKLGAIELLLELMKSIVTDVF